MRKLERLIDQGTGREPADIVLKGGRFFDLVTGESKIGRISTSGAITTLPTPTPEGSPLAITAGPGGIWFTELAGPSVAGFVRGARLPGR